MPGTLSSFPPFRLDISLSRLVHIQEYGRHWMGACLLSIYVIRLHIRYSANTTHKYDYFRQLLYIYPRRKLAAYCHARIEQSKDYPGRPDHGSHYKRHGLNSISSIQPEWTHRLLEV